MPDQFKPVTLQRIAGVAVITADNPPVNAMSRAVRDGLSACLEEAMVSDCAAVVVTCAGRTFFAGADITEFGKLRAGVPLEKLLDAVENAAKPVVVAIHGAALGGGCELALAAHGRVATGNAGIGLPEQQLGLIPGCGGTQRLPRLVGGSEALAMIASGKTMPAQKALSIGLLDMVVAEPALIESAVSLARDLAAKASDPVRTRDRMPDNTDTGFIDDYLASNAVRIRTNPALGKGAECVRAALDGRSFEEGMALEHAAFLELVGSDQSKARRYVFSAQRKAAKVPGLAENAATRDIASVGVVGAGTMGGGIAMCFADAGLPVTIAETSAEALDRGLAVIRRNYERSAKRGRIAPEDVDRRMGLIDGTLDLGAMAGCDLVVEAVFESFDVKQSVFERLDQICKDGAILATNTSAISVDRIAAATSRPGDVLGLHFFSPANVMKLLEVVNGAATDPVVLATAMKLARKLRKIPVVSGVCHGFIANRMVKVRQAQAQSLLLEGVMPWDVDRVLLDFGFPMGPFQMSDLVGLDLGWVKEKSRSETLRDVFCEHGRRGQKTGGGYYDYDESRNRSPSPEAERLIREYVAQKGRPGAPMDDAQILDRCLLPLINEGTKILEEGIALRGSDIDVAWVHGFGWPAWRGGPMYYADRRGLGEISAKLAALCEASPDIAPPSALLTQLAAEGRRLCDYEGS